jgi:WD40 repeat protein
MSGDHGFSCRSMLFLLALQVTASHVFAAEPDPVRIQRVLVDESGDPLPEGAVARIGTIRLRQSSEVCSVAFSPDGKLLATGGRYDGVRLWNSTTGKLLHFLPAKGGQGIFCLAFSPDGNTLVSSGFDGALEVWEVATGKQSRQLGKDSGKLEPLCFSDDGKLLAVADGEIMRVWETTKWTERERQETDHKKVAFPSFADKRMYQENTFGSHYLWDLAELKKQAVPENWRTGYWTALSPDGKRLATSGEKATIFLRDVATGKELNRVELAGQKDCAVSGLCFSPNGKLLAVGGRGIDVRCLDSETGKETVRFGDQQVDYTKLAFSPDGKRLAVTSERGVRLWEVSSGKELLPSSASLHAIRAVEFSPDGKQLAFGDGQWLRLFDTTSRKQVWRSAEERDYAQRIAFAPDGKTLVAGNVSRLRFYDAVTGKVSHSWGRGLGAFDHRDPIELGLFTPDLEKVVSLHLAAFGDANTEVVVCSASSGKELLKFQRRAGRATAASISPNGQLIAIGDWEAPTQLYHLTTGKWISQLDVSGTHWHSLVFAPDGRSLAATDREGCLRLLELATGKTRLKLSGAAPRGGFVYSPNGNVLATWENKTVELWDTLTGRKLGQLAGHSGRITQAAFAPGGIILATASEDTTILLWEVTDPIRGQKSKRLTPEERTSAWKDLTDPDAAKAYRAMISFRLTGSQAVDFWGEQLRPEQLPDKSQIEGWLKDLGDGAFTVRERASDELKKHINVLAPTLRKALAADPSPEVRDRLTLLVEMSERGRWVPEDLRTLRAIEVLERIASPESRTLLKTLASGPPEGRLTREAKASLERLARSHPRE